MHEPNNLFVYFPKRESAKHLWSFQSCGVFERSLPPENKGDGDRHECGAACLFVELNDVTDSEQTLQKVPLRPPRVAELERPSLLACHMLSRLCLNCAKNKASECHLASAEPSSQNKKRGEGLNPKQTRAWGTHLSPLYDGVQKST